MTYATHSYGEDDDNDNDNGLVGRIVKFCLYCVEWESLQKVEGFERRTGSPCCYVEE